jgi:hypothetical protein
MVDCMICGDPKDEDGMCPCAEPAQENGGRLREALQAMIGAFDTPIARRRIGGEFASEARKMARKVLAPKEPNQ